MDNTQFNPSETNLNCQKCGLWMNCVTPWMKSSGSKNPELMVIGEAPGSDEDDEGIQFVGKSGQLLRDALEGLGYKSVRYTNIVRCRPPDNKISKRAIDLCKQFAMDDIVKHSPQKVLLAGNTALQGITGQSGISQYNGIKIVKDGITYIPIYHPAYILRNMNLLDEWLKTLDDALNAQTDDYQHCEYIIPKNVEEVLEMKNELARHTKISYDTELSSLDAFSDVSLLLAVSFGIKGKAYALPIDHPESWWDTDYDTVKHIVIDILTEHSGNIIGHNLKFDQMHTYSMLGIWFEGGDDTMLLNHLIDSRQGVHGLKRLAGIHLGMFEYDEELDVYIKANKLANPRYGGSYASIPLDVLLPYAAKDAEATYKLRSILYKQLSSKQKVFYRQAVMPISDALCVVQCNGIALDGYIAKRYAMIYKAIQGDMYTNILEDKRIKKMSKTRRDGYKFNPNSSVQLLELYQDYYHITLPTLVRPDGKVRPTTSAKALKRLENNFPIIKTMRYYKMMTKMLGTYLIPASEGRWSSGDGRVRTTYNMHGTVTGRLSSSQPVNLQNIPTPEKEPGTILETLPIKNIFTHSYWNNDKIPKASGVLMSIDYSGMELRVFASLAKCKKMIAIQKSGKDQHSVIAIMSMTHKDIKDITDKDIKALPKAIRYRYKWTNWTLLYGGDAHTLSNLYDVPIEEAEETVRMYYDEFPEVLEFGEDCIHFAEINGYIESAFGRREHLYYINDNDRKKRNADCRAAKNMPVQSTASDTLSIALFIIQRELKRMGLKSMLVNTVHDSIVLDVPLEEIEIAASLCKDIMENIADWAAVYAPKLDFSWLISPLRVDIEVGSHWGTEYPLEMWMYDTH